MGGTRIESVDELEEALESSDPAEAEPFGSFVPRLARVLELDTASLFEFETSDFGFALGSASETGFGGQAIETLRPHIDGRITPFALYNPIRPEPAQRNKSTVVHTVDGGSIYLDGEAPRTARPIDMARVLYRRFGVRHQLRVLVCDGPVLLAWVGAMSDRPVDAHARARLQRLVPALARRLSADRRAPSNLAPAALAVALDALPAAAFVTSSSGLVHHANVAARAMLERDHRFGAHLADVVAGRSRDPRFLITRFRPRGMAEHALVTHVPAAPGMAERLAAARRAWGLTRRQAEVLELVVRGEPTKQIAALLSCHERTVELHVTALFAKAGVENRAALVTRFWVPA